MKITCASGKLRTNYYTENLRHLYLLSLRQPHRNYLRLNSSCAHWRRQLWGTGARAPSTYNNLIFSVHFDLYKVWQRLHVSHWLLHVPVLAPTPGDATAFCACHIVFLTWFSLSSSITPSFFHSRLKPTCFTNLSHHIHCFLPSLGLPPRTITRTVSYEQLDFFLLALFLTIYVFVTPCGVYPPAFRRT